MTDPALETGSCGTYAAYQRHRKRGEPVDELCRQARNAYARDIRKRNPSLISNQMAQAKRRRDAAAILIKKHHREYLQILTELKAGQT